MVGPSSRELCSTQARLAGRAGQDTADEEAWPRLPLRILELAAATRWEPGADPGWQTGDC